MTYNNDDYFKAFCKITSSIQLSSKREEILKLIVDSAVEAMSAKACSLFLVMSGQGADGLFYPVAQKGLSENYIHTGPAKGRDITKDILEKGGYLEARDATTDPRLENHEAKKKEGIASLLVVPVIAESDPIGILALYTAEPRDFSQRDREFLAALATHGAIAIKRAEKDARIKRDMELFASISEHLSSSLDIQKVLDLMTSEVARAFELMGVSIRLQDERNNELKLVASYGLSDAYLNKGPVCASRVKSVIDNKVELINDVEAYDIDYKEERRAEGITTMLHLPITVHGKAIGIMGLYSTDKRDTSDDDIKLMSSIARQCGLAIQNASYYLELSRDKKNLEEEIWAHKAWF